MFTAKQKDTNKMVYLIKECFEYRGYNPRFLIEFINEYESILDAWQEIIESRKEWRELHLEFMTKQGIYIKDDKPIKSVYVYDMRHNRWDYRFRIVKRLVGSAKLYYNGEISSFDTGYND